MPPRSGSRLLEVIFWLLDYQVTRIEIMSIFQQTFIKVTVYFWFLSYQLLHLMSIWSVNLFYVYTLLDFLNDGYYRCLVHADPLFSRNNDSSLPKRIKL